MRKHQKYPLQEESLACLTILRQQMDSWDLSTLEDYCFVEARLVGEMN